MITRLKYTGSTPGADANTYVLFSTASPSAGVAGSVAVGNWGPMMCLHTYRYEIKNPQAGTVNGYYSNDRGANWVQFYTMAVAIPAAGEASNDVVLIEGFADFKFEWVNGGVAQTGWTVNQDASTKRAML
jgi:hypothetical protein